MEKYSQASREEGYTIARQGEGETLAGMRWPAWTRLDG